MCILDKRCMLVCLRVCGIFVHLCIGVFNHSVVRIMLYQFVFPPDDYIACVTSQKSCTLNGGSMCKA